MYIYDVCSIIYAVSCFFLHFLIILFTFSFPEISSKIVSQMWYTCRQQGVSMGHILGAWEVSLKYDVITTDLEDGYLDTFVDTFIPLRFTFLFYFLRPDKLA